MRKGRSKIMGREDGTERTEELKREVRQKEEKVST